MVKKDFISILNYSYFFNLISLQKDGGRNESNSK